MGQHYGSKIPRNGLVAYYDAANPKSYPGSGSTWFDLSGNSLHMTMIGTLTHSSSYFEGFADTASYFECSISEWPTFVPTGNQSRTICALARKGNASAYQHIVHWGTATVGRSYGLASYSENFSDHRWSTSNIDSSPTMSFPVGEDVFASVRYHDSLYPGARFSKNTEFLTETDIVSDLNTGTDTFRIGSRISTATETWDGAGGRIYMVAIYNRTLSDEEILQVYQAMKGRVGL